EKHWAIGKLLRAGGVEPTAEVHERAWQWFRAELARTYLADAPTPLAGIEDMFKTLRNNGVKIGLTTGISREIVDIILSAMGWDEGMVDFVAAGDEVELGRPEPFLIQKVMAEAGITDPAEVISSGDTEADVISAQRAGVTSVGVLTGHLTAEQFLELRADHVLDSPAGIVKLISNLLVGGENPMEINAQREPMCARVWTGAQNFELLALAEPSLREGESLTRLNSATICGSDVHTISGRRRQPCPAILGHEGAGVVVATKNPDLAPGQRVTFSVIAPCLKCDRCRQGRTAKCRSVLKTGHEAFDSDWPLSGTYATHIVLRKDQPVAVLSDDLSDTVASVASCAGATVMAAVEAAGDIRDKRVLIVGLGMLGLIACDVALQRGAAEVVVSDPNTQRRQWAQSLGQV